MIFTVRILPVVVVILAFFCWGRTSAKLIDGKKLVKQFDSIVGSSSIVNRRGKVDIHPQLEIEIGRESESRRRETKQITCNFWILTFPSSQGWAGISVPIQKLELPISVHPRAKTSNQALTTFDFQIEPPTERMLNFDERNLKTGDVIRLAGEWYYEWVSK